MKKPTSLTLESNNVTDFEKLMGKGHLSNFCDEKIAEFIRSMQLKYWIVCPKCNRKIHIRVVLNNEGKCTFDDCNAIILEKINGV